MNKTSQYVGTAGRDGYLGSYRSSSSQENNTNKHL